MCVTIGMTEDVLWMWQKNMNDIKWDVMTSIVGNVTWQGRPGGWHVRIQRVTVLIWHGSVEQSNECKEWEIAFFTFTFNNYNIIVFTTDEV